MIRITAANQYPVLGVHEHWNNPVDKQYSRNLGTGNGIELVSIPEDLVKSVKEKGTENELK